ncbi:UNVERIFIED_CONTAM: Transposon Tf2-12 polyprotein [Sesamum radiatum]|uniref:Transposon Tf2-12 polyprotein n=1 Tax=Sesamum radiatum TaxID=300843 RepID=A0AAW2LN17_SESRA
MEVYIDDILIKSIKEQDHIKDLQQCFQILKTFVLKLNPAKCTFGVRGGKFLGYMISERGIEANHKKINAIMDMPPPHSIKDAQKARRPIGSFKLMYFKVCGQGPPVLQGPPECEKV